MYEIKGNITLIFCDLDKEAKTKILDIQNMITYLKKLSKSKKNPIKVKDGLI